MLVTETEAGKNIYILKYSQSCTTAIFGAEKSGRLVEVSDKSKN
jgi:hypothetical protein